MKSIAIALALVFWFTGSAFGAPPALPLAEEEALAVVAMADEVRPESLQLVSIREGSVRKGDFEEAGVFRVTVLRLNTGREGQRGKVLVCRDFRWNEKYGWHLERIEEGRMGAEVRIYSQSLGEVVIR